MKNNSKLLTLGAIALLAGALSSCGSSKVDPYDLDFSVDTNGVTIDFWTPFGSDIQEYVDEICSNFEEETGIKVNCESKGGYDNLSQAINLGATSGKYPHVSLAYPDHMASYVNNDIIVRLDYYLENGCADGYSLNDFYADYIVENQTVEFDENGKGYTLGIPFNKSTEVLCYNKTFFDWASSKDSTIKVPSTWDELWTVAPKINTFLSSYFGKIVGSDYKAYDSSLEMPVGVTSLFDLRSVTADTFFPFTYDSEANFFITACRQWGGTYTEYDKTEKKGYIAFDSNEVINALTELQTNYNNKYFAISNTFGGTTKYNSSYFKNCQSVINVGSSAGVKNSLPTSSAFEVGVAPVLYKDANHKYVISQGTNAILLDKGSKAERVAAWKFIKYITKTIDGYFCANTSYFPSGSYAAASDAYTQKVNETKTSTSADDKIWYATNKVNEDYYLKDSEKWTKFTDPAFVGSSTIRTRLATAMSELLINKQTPRQLIDTLKNDLKAGGYVR